MSLSSIEFYLNLQLIRSIDAKVMNILRFFKLGNVKGKAANVARILNLVQTP